MQFVRKTLGNGLPQPLMIRSGATHFADLDSRWLTDVTQRVRHARYCKLALQFGLQGGGQGFGITWLDAT